MRMTFIVAACLAFASLAARADTVAGDAAFVVKNYPLARQEWLRAATAGDASAMAALGTLYDVGYGVPQDFAEALAWYRRAGEAGDVRAMFNTGVMYDAGRGVTPDRPEALRWYDMAAKHGNGRAAFAAGLMLRDGDGVHRDRARAIHYFRIAAQAGIKAAQDNLMALGAAPPPRAVMRLPNRPPPPPPPTTQPETTQMRDMVLAREPLDAADVKSVTRLAPRWAEQAETGAGIAQYEAGYALEKGYGLKQDPVASYVYYLRATLSAEPVVKQAALRGAAEVSRTLTEEQHAAAREMLLQSAR